MNCFFPEQEIQIFRSVDFNLESDTTLSLKNKKLTILLFKDNSVTSNKVTELFKDLSKEIAGITFGVCDCLTETDVSLKILKIIPYCKYPCILIFKNGIFQDYYKGIYSKVNLFNYIITL